MFNLLVLFWLFLPFYSGVEASLQWPQAYHFKATLKIPSANVVEPYEVWSNGVSGHHRFEFYNGMTKMYQKRRGVLNNVVQFHYFWVRPESTNINENKTICYQLQNNSGEVKLLSHYVPPIYNFNLKGQDVNQTTKWEYSYTGQKYGAVYIYNLWTAGTTKDWVPVKYEYRMMYAGTERDFIQHTYEYFNRAKPDSKVYQIPRDLRCKSLPAQNSDEGLNSGPVSPILRYDMAELFERFKTTHNKQYATHAEHFKRFTAFLKNYRSSLNSLWIPSSNWIFEKNGTNLEAYTYECKNRFINDGVLRYIQSVNRQQGLYKLAVNWFTDLTEDELSKLKTGTKVEPEMIGGTHSFQDNDENDDGFDWRWYDAVSPVKDQTFLCGSCYAFATAAVIESAAYISRGCETMVEMSEQAIIDCSRGKNGNGNQGCNGGYLANSMSWVKTNGIPLRKDYGPYLAMDGYCQFNKSPPQHIHNYTKLPSEIKVMKEALRQYGPLAVLMTVPDSLFYHSSGIYDDKSCSSDIGAQTHAVVIVGYGKEDGIRYWIIRNSWGSQWSDRGYFKLNIENNLCGIANVVYTVTVDPYSLLENCKKRSGYPFTSKNGTPN